MLLEDRDSIWIIFLKILITVSTAIIITFVSIKDGIKIIQNKRRKGPSLGFNKKY